MLRNFEEYPNDVARGFNIPHMPVYYKTQNDWSKTSSPSILIMTPEPDFSMPFNVNAVTHVIFGDLFINTVNALASNFRDKDN